MQFKRLVSLLLCLCFLGFAPLSARAAGNLVEDDALGDDAKTAIHDALRRAAAFLRENAAADGVISVSVLEALYAAEVLSGSAEHLASLPAPTDSAEPLAHAYALLLLGDKPHTQNPSLGSALRSLPSASGAYTTLTAQIEALQRFPLLLPGGLYDAENARRQLAAQQYADGGFYGAEADSVILTAMALPLLEPGARERALLFLAGAANEKGLYDGCRANAAVLSAYAACDSEPAEALRLGEALLAHQLPNGAFREGNAEEPSIEATCAAVTALGELCADSPLRDALAPSFYADEDEAVSREALLTVSRYGLLCGDGTGYYRPAETVTRAEFAQILYSMLGEGSERAAFLDVPKTAWYAHAVGSVVSGGYMTEGLEGFLFRPTEPVTRLEVSVALAKLLTLDGEHAMDALREGRYAIQDISTVAELQRPAVAAVCYEGLLDADNGFRPNGVLRRDELAVLLYHIYT